MMTHVSLEVKPIGKIKLLDELLQRKYEIPSQGYMDDIYYEVVLDPHQNFEQALRFLEGFSHIWIIFNFHEVDNWKPMVVPPRGPEIKRGVFATRSPHRPNRLGMTAVRLQKISGLSLIIGGGDFLDNTPVLDIKPYINSADSIPEATGGWLDEIDDYKWEVVWNESATLEAADILKNNRFHLMKYADRILTYNRETHPYKRIHRISSTEGYLKIQYWKVHFELNAERRQVSVKGIEREEID